MTGISLLSSCLLVAGLAAPPQEPAATSKPTDKAADKKQEETEKDQPGRPPCRVRLRVVDPLGKSVPRAGVVLAREKLQTLLALHEPAFRGDAEGRVEFTLPAPEDEDDTSRFTMLLAAPGRMAHSRTLSYPRDTERPEIDLGEIILGRGVMLEGRVRGEDGRPIAGATVTASDSMARRLFTRYGSTGRHLRYHRSHGITDKRGAFLLPGVHAAAMHLEISADGYEQQALAAVSIRQPLDVTLRRTGFVSGKVVDDESQPIEDARVRIAYEVDPSTSYEKTGKDGSFRIPLRHPHRYRLYAYVTGNRSRLYKKAYSKVLDAPAKDLVIQVERLAPARPDGAASGGILLQVTDAATGGVVEKFKAAALWMNIQPYTQERYIQRRFRSLARDARMPGELRLLGPKNNQPQTGLVIVQAEGYAQLKLEDVEWPQDKLVKLEARLAKESVLSGVVLDETTRKPVAGARVYAVRDDPGSRVRQVIYYGNRSPTPSDAVTTDDKGAFRIGELGKGRYELHVWKADRPSPEPLKLELKEAEQRGGLSLALPRGTTLSGRITGAEPQPGWRVKMVPRRDLNRNIGQVVFYSYSPYSATPGPTAPLARDGRFELKGLAKGVYDLRLLIPRGLRCGPPVEIFIDPLRLRGADITRDFDASQDRPARIKGRLKVTGAPIPVERLVVVATDLAASRHYYTRMDSSLIGARSLLKRDGSFELLVDKGLHLLKVVDLETGIAMLKEVEGFEVEAGQTVKRDLELAVALARVSLKPAREGDEIVASHLEVKVQHPKPKTGGVVFGSSGNVGASVSLADGSRRIDLFLPLLETSLAVRTNSHRLHKSRSGNAPTLADHEFIPEEGEINKVELLVAAPPEVKDPEEAGAKTAGKAVDAKPGTAAAMARVLEAAKKKAAQKEEAQKKAAKEPGKTRSRPVKQVETGR